MDSLSLDYKCFALNYYMMKHKNGNQNNGNGTRIKRRGGIINENGDIYEGEINKNSDDGNSNGNDGGNSNGNEGGNSNGDIYENRNNGNGNGGNSNNGDTSPIETLTVEKQISAGLEQS